ncbi:MAG: hypothetical protein AM324_007220 [Candidatus Thorarchaeota archaeon SMTZ1-83]|nr:MAG: hypothetical protein AM324_08455 [Candidatus Thorarchaeota archaeon SMTZ1-83]
MERNGVEDRTETDLALGIFLLFSVKFVKKALLVLAPDIPRTKGDLGLRKTLSFVFRSLGKIMRKMITDSRYGRIRKIDREVNIELEKKAGYALIAGRKLVESV